MQMETFRGVIYLILFLAILPQKDLCANISQRISPKEAFVFVVMHSESPESLGLLKAFLTDGQFLKKDMVIRSGSKIPSQHEVETELTEDAKRAFKKESMTYQNTKRIRTALIESWCLAFFRKIKNPKCSQKLPIKAILKKVLIFNKPIRADVLSGFDGGESNGYAAMLLLALKRGKGGSLAFEILYIIYQYMLSEGVLDVDASGNLIVEPVSEAS